MLVPSTSLIVFTAITAGLLNILIPWIRNIQRAKASGIPYVLIPYYSYNRVTGLLAVRLFLRPFVKYLGEPSPISWRTLAVANWPWKRKHTPFAMLGTDTFLTVAPGGIIFNTADADVIAQLISRPTDFPKASHLYKSVNIYGENVVAAEGATWRYHRKLMSPALSESNNQLVWKRSLQDGQAMLSRWLESRARPITTLAQDTMLLSLSVIGHAGFGQSIQWPGATRDTNANTASDKLPAGHQMTFTVALTTLIHSIFYIVIFPLWLLKKGPFKAMKRSYLAYIEWDQYLREIISSKREAIANSTTSLNHKPNSTSSSTNDILTQLLKENEQPQSDSSKQSTPLLSTSSVLGNLFVMLIAGHETSANSIHFSLALLAMHPHIQAKVQRNLESIFSGRSPDSWSYERDLPALLNSDLNAVLHEQLRLLPPTVTIPKYTTSAQTLRVGGKQVTIPAKTITRACLPSVHQNPACWPTSSASLGGSVEDKVKDLATFNPSRWFTPSGTWYQPPKGTYIPFSDGARACLGKRFAQVEILAVLAVILSSHTVELAVDESTLETEGGGTHTRSGNDEKLRKAWYRAREEAERAMKEKMVVIITLQLGKGAYVPVRIVPRGEERFAGIV